MVILTGLHSVSESSHLRSASSISEQSTPLSQNANRPPKVTMLRTIVLQMNKMYYNFYAVF